MPWYIGTPHLITWSSEDFFYADDNDNVIDDTVKIEISRDGGLVWSTIIGDTPNTGSYSWVVSGPETASAIIRFSGVSNTDATAMTSEFAINADIPMPWYIGISHSIRWSSEDFFYADSNDAVVEDTVKIEVSHDGGLAWSTIVDGAPNTGSYSWVVSGPMTTNAILRFSGVNNTEATSETIEFAIEAEDIYLLPAFVSTTRTINTPYVTVVARSLFQNQMRSDFLSMVSPAEFGSTAQYRPVDGSTPFAVQGIFNEAGTVASVTSDTEYEIVKDSFFTHIQHFKKRPSYNDRITIGGIRFQVINNPIVDSIGTVEMYLQKV